MFADAKATTDLLSTIAGGIITVTSITISLLLLALQQVAGSLTAEVYDQFLRRRHNQAYFGFFVGLALYALVTLATVNVGFNPVFGATLAFLLTIIALYLLIVLLYTTINQMRPPEVIDEIHRHILWARQRQLQFIHRTRPVAHLGSAGQKSVTSVKSGYVTAVDLDVLEAAAREAGVRSSSSSWLRSVPTWPSGMSSPGRGGRRRHRRKCSKTACARRSGWNGSRTCRPTRPTGSGSSK